MPVEVECYKIKIGEEEILDETYSIDSGSFKHITYLKDVGLLAFCPFKGSVAKILFQGKNISANYYIKIFENESDRVGKYVSPVRELPLHLEGEQSLSVFTKWSRNNRMVYLFLNE